MAEEGTFRAFLDKMGAVDTQDKNAFLPDPGTGDTRMELSPEKMMEDRKANSDPGNVYNDQGQVVDYNPNPFSNILKGLTKKSPAEQGTLRNFLDRMSGNPVDVGSTSEFVAPGTTDASTTNPTPMVNQPQPNLQPKKNYAVPSALPPDALPQLRNSLLTGAGLDPATYTPDGPDANSLAGRMNSPNAPAEIRNSVNDLQKLEDDMRGFDGSRSARLKAGANAKTSLR